MLSSRSMLQFKRKIQRLNPALSLAVVCVFLAAGCSGLVSSNGTTPQNPQTFSLTGTITPSNGGSGATLTLSGAKSMTVTADASGNFAFAGLANGAYTVTPSHAGFSFSPLNQSANVSGANVSGLNFTAIPQQGPTFAISGTISPASSGNGATVTLSGAASATVTADASGSYTFSGLSNGSYAVTPSHSGFVFAPTTQSATISGANVTGVNFTGSAGQTFSISGTITNGNGARVALSGNATASTTADSSGNFSFNGLSNGAYTVTPTEAGFVLSPLNRAVTVSGANVSGVNFTATSSQNHTATASWGASTSVVIGYNVYRGTISGGPYSKINSSPISGLTFTDSTVQNAKTYFYVVTAIDGNGNESVNSNEVQAVIP